MRARLPFSLVLVLSIAACASGVGGEPDAGTPGDMGRRDMALRDASRDGPRTDMPVGDFCMGVICVGFQFCDRGSCVSFDACTPAGGCPETSDICRSRYCVPRDRDVDGDGVTAETDCDETNAMIAPGLPDVCNAVDDDCSGTPDDGAPAVSCAPGTGTCISGACGCPPGQYDLDSMPDNGCECMGTPGPDVGLDCTAPQDLGDVADSAQMQMIAGNVLPATRDVWYRFRGVDSADTSCDALHVRLQFLTNPDSAFEFTVFRGACGTLPVGCADMGYTDFSFATDFTMGMTGECPCTAAPTDGVNVCGDQTAEYFVRVRRKPGMPVACAGYTLELTNGVY